MRFDSWRFSAFAGLFLAAVSPAGALHGEGTLTILSAPPVEAVSDEAPSPPATLQWKPAPPQQPVASRSTAAAAPAATPRAIPRVAAPVFTQPFVEPQVTNQTRQALGFYGGYSARATLSQLPRRAPLQSSSQPVRRHAKPFSSIQSDPTVSPYLNLYRDEENVESIPNYFAFVRPQLEQLETNRVQHREIQQLRGQLQGMSSTVAGPQYQSAGMPGTGTAARYMDTAQFYGGWRR